MPRSSLAMRQPGSRERDTSLAPNLALELSDLARERPHPVRTRKSRTFQHPRGASPHARRPPCPPRRQHLARLHPPTNSIRSSTRPRLPRRLKPSPPSPSKSPNSTPSTERRPNNSVPSCATSPNSASKWSNIRRAPHNLDSFSSSLKSGLPHMILRCSLPTAHQLSGVGGCTRDKEDHSSWAASTEGQDRLRELWCASRFRYRHRECPGRVETRGLHTLRLGAVVSIF